VPIVASERPELLARHDVEIELFWTGSPPAALQALANGALHLIPTSPEAVWPAQARLDDLFQLMAVANGTPYVIVANPRVKKIEDLRGQSVGAVSLRGSPDTTAMRAVLQAHGLQDGDYSIIPQGGDSTTIPAGAMTQQIAALQAGVFMAVAHLEPLASRFREAGLVELAYGDAYPRLRAVQSVVAVGRRVWYERNSNLLTRFIRGWMDVTAWVYAPEHRAEVAEIMSRMMRCPPAAAENAYERHVVMSRTMPLDPRVSLERVEQTAALQRDLGGENVPASIARYVDNRIAELAYQQGTRP
jgi:ABC-type nitrate/sulfonate/bicarbonate transport system substrate-binding protein